MVSFYLAPKKDLCDTYLCYNIYYKQQPKLCTHKMCELSERSTHR